MIVFDTHYAIYTPFLFARDVIAPQVPPPNFVNVSATVAEVMVASSMQNGLASSSRRAFQQWYSE